MTLEEEVRELRRRIVDLEGRPTDPKYLPIRTPWMDSWRPVAPAPTVFFVGPKEAIARALDKGKGSLLTPGQREAIKRAHSSQGGA